MYYEIVGWATIFASWEYSRRYRIIEIESINYLQTKENNEMISSCIPDSSPVPIAQECDILPG